MPLPVDVEVADDLVTVAPTPAMCAGAPVLTSGTAITGVTVRGPAARPARADAGIVTLQLPSAAGVVETGDVVVAPSLAETDTPVASGCATPDTVRSASEATVPGALVIAFCAHGAIEAQPAMGPRTAPASSLGWTVVLSDVPVPPKKDRKSVV